MSDVEVAAGEASSTVMRVSNPTDLRISPQCTGRSLSDAEAAFLRGKRPVPAVLYEAEMMLLFRRKMLSGSYFALI